MNNSGKGLGAMATLGIIAFGLIVVVGLILVLMPAGQPLTIPTTTPTTPTTGACPGNVAPSGVLNVFESINKNTKVTDVNAIVYFQQNGKWVEDKTYNLASDNSIDGIPNTQAKIVLVPGTGDNPGIDFVGKDLLYTFTCNDRQTISETGQEKVFVDRQGTASFTAYNSDDGLTNSDSDLESIGTGETVSVKFKYKEGTADKCIGSSYSPLDLMTCEDWNSTCINTVEVTNGTLTDTPNGHSTTRSTTSTLDSSKCYALTGVKQICDFAETSDIKNFSLKIEAKASVNPGGSASCDVNTNLYVPTQFLDQESGEMKWGYRDAYDGNMLMPITSANISIN